jgi:DNA polymerase-3 subunit gamma/tau
MHILYKNPEKVLEFLDELNKSGKDMKIVCAQLLENFRREMVDLITKNQSHLENANLPDIISILENLQKVQIDISKGANPRISLEVALMKLSAKGANSPKKISETSAESVNLHKKTSEISTNSAKISLEKSAEKVNLEEEISNENSLIEPPKTAPVAAFSNENESSDMKIFAPWETVLREIEGHSRTLAAAFKGSRAFENWPYLLIDARQNVAFELLRNATHRDKIRSILKKLTGREYKLGPYLPQKNATKNLLNDLMARAKLAGVEILEQKKENFL